jgi:hypothetical protein
MYARGTLVHLRRRKGNDRPPRTSAQRQGSRTTSGRRDSPPHDVSDMTAQLGCRAIMDVLGTLVEEGHLGRRPRREERPEEQPEAQETGD